MIQDPMQHEDVAVLVGDLLTPIQLHTWRLEAMGMSTRQVALAQGVTRQTVRGCLRTVYAKLAAAGVKQRFDGSWYIKEVKR